MTVAPKFLDIALRRLRTAGASVGLDTDDWKVRPRRYGRDGYNLCTGTAVITELGPSDDALVALTTMTDAYDHLRTEWASRELAEPIDG